MFDDGQHGDSSAGDGLYGATVRVGAGNIEYYVYAENREAGVFSPPRAEHEFFSAPVAGTVAINEFMAENVSAVRDPSGQYDDWIELYNNRSSPLSLDGYFLSDDSTRPFKWQFPYVTIPAGGFITVWADSDMVQPGVHAGFRLNASGEMLLLTDPDGRQVDRVVFGPQSADISFGRYPDGVGTFRLMNPTFGQENDSVVGIEGPGVAPPVRFFATAYPNPFVNATTIRYLLPVAGRIRLQVYDVTGRLVAQLADGPQPAGLHEVKFSARKGEMADGIYFAELAVECAGARIWETVKLTVAR